MAQHISVGDGGLSPSIAGKHTANDDMELVHDPVVAATPLVHPSATRTTAINTAKAWTFEANFDVPVVMFAIAALLKSGSSVKVPQRR